MRFYKLIIFFLYFGKALAGPLILCDSSKGLELINQEFYSQEQLNSIIEDCDKVAPNDPQTLLLHALLSRKEASNNQGNYLNSLLWFKKANQVAPKNLMIKQEWAATFELAKQYPQAMAVYQSILAADPKNRGAMLAMARIYRIEGKFQQAIPIYQKLLTIAPHDVDAINGLALVKTAEKDFVQAQALFNESLEIRPQNPEALAGLKAVLQTINPVKVLSECQWTRGLELVNQANPPLLQIKAILNDCANHKIDTTETQLLHGLVARREALSTKNFTEAIAWLQKAVNSAKSENKGPTLELALTYEWAKQYAKANPLYDYILAFEPGNKPALLGKARILGLEGDYPKAEAMYQTLLQKNPQDTDTLNALGWLEFREKNIQKAKTYFQQSLIVQATNPEALTGLAQIKAQALVLQPVALPCPVDQGLKLVNEKNPQQKAIEAILTQCEQAHFQNTTVELLRGLLARQVYKDKEKALFWLKKAKLSAEPSNHIPALELALTYEKAGELNQANAEYQEILGKESDNRPALLGKARILRAEKKWPEVLQIYQSLLAKNPKDLDALNGMGWIALAQNDLKTANLFFKTGLEIDPKNEEILLALNKIAYIEAHPPVVPVKPPCEADEGLMLLNQDKPDFAKIETILKKCDRTMPNATSTLMLHGLLERLAASAEKRNFKTAIAWLKLAVKSATRDNKAPVYELAVTYEWAALPRKALYIYQTLLFTNAKDTFAQLGEARVLRSLYKIKPSIALYLSLLDKNPKNIEALTGLGETYLTNYEFAKARTVFDEVLNLEPHNEQVLNDLKILHDATRNILGISGGHYAVPPSTSEGLNVFYFRNLNATDRLTMLATHNTRQIESGFSSGPTLLPNNSLLVGYERLIPSQYGWLVSYDSRQHYGLPFEHRTYGRVSAFVTKFLEAHGDVRLVFPKPWNTALVISGLTAYTPLPANISVTGFWAFQQIGGRSDTYALDLSKEFNNRFFYDLGTSFLPREKSWEVHGRVIVPTFQNQALVGEYSHYFFNRSTFATLGWRFYWA